MKFGLGVKINMINYFDVRLFFNTITYLDYVILKMSDTFPEYVSNSDIDILCRNIKRFENSFLSSWKWCIYCSCKKWKIY